MSVSPARFRKRVLTLFRLEVAARCAAADGLGEKIRSLRARESAREELLRPAGEGYRTGEKEREFIPAQRGLPMTVETRWSRNSSGRRIRSSSFFRFPNSRLRAMTMR